MIPVFGLLLLLSVVGIFWPPWSLETVMPEKPLLMYILAVIAIGSTIGLITAILENHR